MKLNTLEDLYVHELKDLFSAEQQIIKALPKMAKAASERARATPRESSV
jgi:ferritin-like metal-binding protein YciE